MNFYLSIIISLLSEYRFFVAAVGLGVVYSIHQKRGIPPMVFAGMVGSMSDLANGYFYTCRKEFEEYKKSSK
jgi:hypothetical protein